MYSFSLTRYNNQMAKKSMAPSFKEPCFFVSNYLMYIAYLTLPLH